MIKYDFSVLNIPGIFAQYQHLTGTWKFNNVHLFRSVLIVNSVHGFIIFHVYHRYLFLLFKGFRFMISNGNK